MSEKKLRLLKRIFLSFLCLFFTALFISVVLEPTVTAQQDAWKVTLEEGKKATSNLKINNRCSQPHHFRLEENMKYLSFNEPVESILVAPGTSKPVGVTFDATGLKPKVYEDDIDIICLDCKKEKTCTQDKDKHPVQLTVIKPSGSKNMVPTTTSSTPSSTSPSELGCCNCLGGTNILDLSTIPSNKWTVNGNPAVFLLGVNAGWNLPTSGAKWVSVSQGAWIGSLAGGEYIYKLQFTVPNCAISQKITLTGNYGADNRAKIYLDDSFLEECTGSIGRECFAIRSTPKPFQSLVTPGNHYLIVKVNNDANSPTGMFVNAKLTGLCTTG